MSHRSKASSRDRDRRGRGKGRGIPEPQVESPQVPPTFFAPYSSGYSPDHDDDASLSTVPSVGASSVASRSDRARPSVPNMQPNVDDAGPKVDSRLFIYPTIQKEFGEFNADATKKIGNLIDKLNKTTAPSYKKVPKRERDMWFNEFNKFFRWNPIDERRIRKIFDTKMSNSFKGKMYYTRTVRNKKPKNLQDDQYAALLAYWESEGFDEKSDRAAQNRASDCGGRGQIMHYGGAKPRSAYEKEMRDELHREPRVDEVFLRMYSRKKEDGNIEWASEATEVAYNRYLENIAPHTISEEGEEPIIPPPDVQMQVWAQTQGVSKKGTVLGLSGRANSVRPLHIGRTQNNYGDPQLLPETVERVAQVETQMATMREEMQKMQSRHQAELEQYRMMLNLALQNRTGQPSQPGQNFTVNEPFHHQVGREAETVVEKMSKSGQKKKVLKEFLLRHGMECGSSSRHDVLENTSFKYPKRPRSKNIDRVAVVEVEGRRPRYGDASCPIFKRPRYGDASCSSFKRPS